MTNAADDGLSWMDNVTFDRNTGDIISEGNSTPSSNGSFLSGVDWGNLWGTAINGFSTIYPQVGGANTSNSGLSGKQQLTLAQLQAQTAQANAAAQAQSKSSVLKIALIVGGAIALVIVGVIFFRKK